MQASSLALPSRVIQVFREIAARFVVSAFRGLCPIDYGKSLGLLGRRVGFWAGIALIGIATLDIHSCRSDLENTVRVFLLPERFISEAYSKVESGFDGFKARYFVGGKSATERNSKLGRLLGVDSNLPPALMNCVRRDRRGACRQQR